MRSTFRLALALVLALAGTAAPPPGPRAAVAQAADRQAEDLDRGLISVRSGTGNYVGWRLLGTDPPGTTFNLYRGTARVATVTNSTNHWDEGAPAGVSYTVRPVVDGVEGAPSGPRCASATDT